MSKSAKVYAYAEFTDEARQAGATDYAGLLVPMPAKIAWERTARAKGYDLEHQPFTFALYLSWWTGQQTGHHTIAWEQFADNVIDASVEQDQPEAVDPVDVDPTGPATASPGPTVSTVTPSPSPSNPASPPSGGSPTPSTY